MSVQVSDILDNKWGKAVKMISALTAITAASQHGRRSFLKLLGGGFLGATVMTAGVGGIERARQKMRNFRRYGSPRSC
jgi:hypothetical protein